MTDAANTTELTDADIFGVHNSNAFLPDLAGLCDLRPGILAFARAVIAVDRARQDEAITWATEGVQQIIVERDALKVEVEALRRGEYVCKRCGLRKDADADGAAPF